MMSMKRTEMRTIRNDYSLNNGNSYALIDHLHKQTISTYITVIERKLHFIIRFFLHLVRHYPIVT